MMERTSSLSSSDSDRPSPRYRRKRSTSTSSVSKSSKRKTRGDCIRVVVVGHQGVGKSALTVRLLTKRFIGTYQSDKDVVYKNSDILSRKEGKEKTMRLEILDTAGAFNAGDEEGTNPTTEMLYWSTATVLVYDITNLQSFLYVTEMLREIKRERPNHVCLLLGNKTDLSHMREVSSHSVDQLIADYTNCIHSEVSAATCDYLSFSDTFQQLFTLSKNENSKSGVKRRRSLVDMAKAFGTLLRSASTKHTGNKSS